MYVHVSEYTSAFIDKDCAFFRKVFCKTIFYKKKAKFIFILNVSINLKRNAIIFESLQQTKMVAVSKSCCINRIEMQTYLNILEVSHLHVYP